MGTPKKLQLAAWSLSFVVTAAAFIAWGQGLSWQFGNLSSYGLFPLFGLLAFSLMWGHYIMGAVRQHLRIDRLALQSHFKLTGWIVLVAMFLHPGLLVWQLWRDGFGLPPRSYMEHYVAPGLAWVTTLGAISFLAFMAYELHRKFYDRPWWKYVEYANAAAMFAIFYHALRLGGTLQGGWYRSVWFFYGTTLAAALIYAHIIQLRTRKT